MLNHFTRLSLDAPLGAQRLDVCDLYAFPVARWHTAFEEV
jgi:hypothetical protein